VSSAEKKKELKIEMRRVIAPEQVLKNRRQMQLLQIINEYGDISEKGLAYLLSELKGLGLDVGYSFAKIGGVPASKDLKDDVMALLYVGFLEVVGKSKKLRITASGKEALEKAAPVGLPANLKELIEKVRAKVAAVDAEVELQAAGKR